MGLFDYLHCKYPLPVDGANALEFQTKDTDAQYMDHYEIREDGSLWHEDYDTEDHSDPNAKGLMRFAGCQARVNKRWTPEKYTGEISFGTSWQDDPFDGWVEFSAYFVNGQLSQLHLIENRAAKVSTDAAAAPDDSKAP